MASAPSGPAGAVQQAFEADRRRRNLILIVAGVFAVLAAIAFGLNRAGVLQLGSRQKEISSLQAQGQVPNPSLLQAHGSSPDPTLARPAEAPRQMPSHIREWLEHLRRTEERKVEITTQQRTEMIGLIATFRGAGGLTSPADVDWLTDPNTDISRGPLNDPVQGLIRRLTQRWEDLRQFFLSVPPPPECVQIQSAYATGISEVLLTMEDLGRILNDMNALVTGDIGRAQDQAQRVGSGHRQGIDEQFRTAQQRFEEICRQYNTTPWFRIDASGHGAGGALGIPGF
jgi:hypothetical protein